MESSNFVSLSVDSNKTLTAMVNVENILFFKPYKSGKTRIYFIDGTIFDVCEDYEDLRSRLLITHDNLKNV